jgi:hypothetical protein
MAAIFSEFSQQVSSAGVKVRAGAVIHPEIAGKEAKPGTTETGSPCSVALL